MLFSPEAHEALADEPWSAERVRTAIAAVVAEAESVFDDGWPAHPRDLLDHEDPATRFRNMYDGGAGVVEALHRLARHSRSQDGHGRYSLWTGDLGTALYLADCIDGRGELPLP